MMGKVKQKQGSYLKLKIPDDDNTKNSKKEGKLRKHFRDLSDANYFTSVM